jgi:hypothetical protein
MRPAYVMSAVTPPERAAAASMTGRAAQPGRVAETFAGRLALCGQLAGFDSRQPSGHHILRSLRNGRIWPTTDVDASSALDPIAVFNLTVERAANRGRPRETPPSGPVDFRPVSGSHGFPSFRGSNRGFRGARRPPPVAANRAIALPGYCGARSRSFMSPISYSVIQRFSRAFITARTSCRVPACLL